MPMAGSYKKNRVVTLDWDHDSEVPGNGAKSPAPRQGGQENVRELSMLSTTGTMARTFILALGVALGLMTAAINEPRGNWLAEVLGRTWHY